MNFQAEPITINTLLSQSKRYFIPRYQREFSWKKEQIEELWNDIVDNLEEVNGELTCSEYFLGTLVLAGSDDSFDVEIVDGQQRITIITILIALISRKLLGVGQEAPANSTFNNYIKGTDRRGREFKKLDKRSQSNYFSLLVQDVNLHECETATDEDRRIQEAYQVIESLLSVTNISKCIFQKDTIDQEEYTQGLFVLLDQVVDHLKVIRVNVIDQDEAYLIFEILNARGINLSPVDLIKNKVLAEWDNQYPIDFAKQKWDEISSRLSQRETKSSLEDYVLHWWVTRYPYTSKRNLYKAFRKKWQSGNVVPRLFLEDLHSASELYIKIASPETNDWTQADQMPIFNSLSALKTFNISINRPFLMSLFLAKRNRKIRQSFLIEILEKLEAFHFAFNAICSMRPSGIEGAYSKAARLLHEAADSREGRNVINDLIARLGDRLPSETTFLEKFKKLKFTNSFTKDKKLIQYLFIKMELHTRDSNEFYPENLTLEHILSQSAGNDNCIGAVGNLLPIGEQLNGDAGTRPFPQKINTYRNSDYRIVQTFVQENEHKTIWERQDIESRTEQIARMAFHDVWSLSHLTV